MIRNILRQHPAIYTLVRNLHNIQTTICRYSARRKLGSQYKQKLQQVDKTASNIWYFCIPLHNNLGDYAQYSCIKKWIKETYPGHNLIEVPSDVIGFDYVGNLQVIAATMKDEDLIIFQSGYTSTDLHDDEKVHRIIVSRFPNNRIIFFPQTVRYSSEEEARKTAAIYNAHRHLLFMARDKRSFETAKTFFNSTKVILMPDIVTTLIGSYPKKNDRKGIFFCIRHDSEKKFSDALLNNAFESLSSPDDTWGDTTLEKGETCSEEIITNTIEQFSKHRLVITDRFHGTIFSMVASTPLIVLPTVDHKVTEGAEWFLNIYPRNIVKVATLEEALCHAKNMINTKAELIDKRYFKEHYYDALISTINEL